MSDLSPQFIIDQDTVRLSARQPVRWEHCHVDLPVPPHGHEFVEICLVVGGTALHTTPEGAAPLSEHEVLVLFPGSVHAFKKVRKLDVINLYFLPEWFLPEIQLAGSASGILTLFFGNVLSGRRGQPLFQSFHVAKETMGEIARELHQLRAPDATPLWTTCCFFKILQLLAGGYRQQATSAGRPLSRVAWECFGEIDQMVRTGGKLDLAVMARRLGMTRDHLGRLFRQEAGRTLTSFYQQRRLQFVCRLLLENGQTLAEIAHQLGYADEAHMCRLFRREQGMTPSAYRRRFSFTALPG